MPVHPNDPVLNVFEFWMKEPDCFWNAVDKGVIQITPPVQTVIDAVLDWGTNGEKGDNVIKDISQV